MPISTNINEKSISIKESNVTRLTENVTFYVRNNGLDTNSGRSAKKAWKTINHAYRYIKKYIQTNKYSVFIDIEDGKYVLDELCQTALVFSPATINDDKVVISKDEYKNYRELNTEIEKLKTQQELLFTKISELENNPTRENIDISVIQAEIKKYIEIYDKSIRTDIKYDNKTIAKELSSIVESVEETKLITEKSLDNLEIELIALELRKNEIRDSLVITNKRIEEVRKQTTENAEANKWQWTRIEENIKLLSEVEKDLKRHQNTLEKQNKDLENAHTLIRTTENLINQYISDNKEKQEKIKGLLYSHVSDYNNPHEVDAGDVVINDSGNNIKETVENLIVNTREPIDNNVELQVNLSTFLKDLAENCDCRNETVTIDLMGETYSDVILCDIPTAMFVLIKNGTINNKLFAKNIHTEYLFENITFVASKQEDAVIYLENCTYISLEDITLKGGRKADIINSNSFLQLNGEIRLQDAKGRMLITQNNAVVKADEVSIIPPVSRDNVDRLLFALSNSTQIWENCTVEGDIGTENIAARKSGGVISGW